MPSLCFQLGLAELKMVSPLASQVPWIEQDVGVSAGMQGLLHTKRMAGSGLKAGAGKPAELTPYFLPLTLRRNLTSCRANAFAAVGLQSLAFRSSCP